MLLSHSPGAFDKDPGSYLFVTIREHISKSLGQITQLGEAVQNPQKFREQEHCLVVSGLMFPHQLSLFGFDPKRLQLRDFGIDLLHIHNGSPS